MVLRTAPWLTAVLAAVFSAAPVPAAQFRVVQVADDAALRDALREAAAGTTIRIAPGRYTPNLHIAGLEGTAAAPIVIEGADPADPPRFEGGRQGMHLSEPAHVVLRHLLVDGASGNGINIDDGGSFETPARHLLLEDLQVYNVGPRGNHDGIKLSGVTDFVIRGCTIEGWGGQAIDMVGCHRGLIERCVFRGREGFSQHTGPQTKGGSSEIVIRRCFFDRAGLRPVHVGGSTGMPYFRPQGARWEAKDITVEGNVFVGGQCAVAFTGVDGAVFRQNTVYRPERWIFRILQETTAPGFAPCRNVRFERNLVVFRRDEIAGAANIGPHTAPETFTFAENLWYCEDRPQASGPKLPAPERQGRYGIDPEFADPDAGDFRPRHRQAAGLGAFGRMEGPPLPEG